MSENRDVDIDALVNGMYVGTRVGLEDAIRRVKALAQLCREARNGWAASEAANRELHARVEQAERERDTLVEALGSIIDLPVPKGHSSLARDYPEWWQIAHGMWLIFQPSVSAESRADLIARVHLTEQLAKTENPAEQEQIIAEQRRQRIGPCSCNDPYCPRCTSDTGTEAFGAEGGVWLTAEEQELVVMLADHWLGKMFKLPEEEYRQTKNRVRMFRAKLESALEDSKSHPCEYIVDHDHNRCGATKTQQYRWEGADNHREWRCEQHDPVRAGGSAALDQREGES